MRVHLGDWTCPTGNGVEAFFRRDQHDQIHVEFEWDCPPPLTAADHAYYLTVVVPAITQLVAEYTETEPKPVVYYVAL